MKGKGERMKIKQYEGIHVSNENIDEIKKRIFDIEQGIELQIYGKYDPVEKYGVRAKKEFDTLIKSIKLNIVTQLMFSTNYY